MIATAIGAVWLAAWLGGFTARWTGASLITVKASMALGLTETGMLALAAALWWRRSELVKQSTAVRMQAEAALRRSEARFRLLSDITARLLAMKDPRTLIGELCQEAMVHLDCQAFFNYLVDEPTGRLRLNACAGISEEEVRKIEWLDGGESACGCIACDGRRISAEDMRHSADPSTELAEKYGFQAYCCYPLRAGERLIGTLSFGATARACFTAEEMELMRIVADQIAVAMGHILAQQILYDSEQRLRLMNERFLKALRGSPITVFDQDSDLRYTWIYNPAPGYISQDIIGKRDSDLFECPEDAAATEAIKRKVLASGQPEHREVVIRLHGVDRYYDLIVEPQRGDDGAVTGITCATMDITEHKHAELHAQFLNRLTLELAQLADGGKIFLTAAHRVGEYFGALRCIISEVDYPAGSFIVEYDWGRDVPSIAGTYSLSDFAAPEVLATLAAGGAVIIDDVATDPRASTHLVAFESLGVRAWLAVPFHDEVGWQGGLTVQSAVPRAWCGDEVQLLRNVAARVWPAVQRARALTALRGSEERYRSLVEQAVDGIFVCDAQGRYLDVNTTGAAMLGYSPEEILQMSIPDVLAADEIPRLVRAAARFSGGGVARGEWRFRRKDGSGFLGEVVGRQLPDGRLQAILRDITERKQTEAKLLEQAEQLREADRRKDEFLAMLAHELRNPLAPIRNAVHLLKCDSLNEPRLAWCREIIDRQVEHLSRLVDDLLDVSRITRGKIELRKEPLDVATVVQRAVETSRPLTDSRRHVLSVHLPPEPLRVEGDLVRLAQVVSNLLNNAAKYTDEGGYIRLSVEETAGEVLIRVRDTGRGIDPAAMPVLFDLFYQVDRTLDRSEGGLGIGLSLVKRLVDMHGGCVEVYSAGRSQGSEFVIRLPRLPDSLAIDAPASSVPTPVHGKLSILVVDDNRDAAESLAMLLGMEGHEMLTAFDGKKAVELALSERPAVVLLDIGLPRLNGYEACRRMREGGLGDALIVAMTGYGQEEDRRLSGEAGFNAHLVKPVEPAVIQELLAREEHTLSVASAE